MCPFLYIYIYESNIRIGMTILLTGRDGAPVGLAQFGVEMGGNVREWGLERGQF